MVTQQDGILSVLKEELEADARSFTPLYLRLQRAIRSLIDDGMLDADDALPSERDLSQALGVSRVTVRNAIRDLVEDGLLVQRRGAGTFVSRRIEMTLTAPTSFSEDIIARGMEPEYRMLDFHVGPATPLEADMLELGEDAQVTRLYRLRVASGKPMCLELACVPTALLPGDVELNGSLYSYLSERKARPVRAIQKLRAQLFETEQARLLGVATGAAGLFIEQQSFRADGVPVEYVRSHYRGDAYDFVIELKTQGAA